MTLLALSITILLLALLAYRAFQRALRVDRFKSRFQSLYPPSETVTWLARPGQRPLLAHLYKPSGWHHTDQRPCIVLFFGGAWRVGSAWQFAPFAQRLCALGAVVVLPEYRIKSRDRSTVDEAVTDGFAVMNTVRESADCLGIDLARISVGGGSAGGGIWQPGSRRQDARTRLRQPTPSNQRHCFCSIQPSTFQLTPSLTKATADGKNFQRRRSRNSARSTPCCI